MLEWQRQFMGYKPEDADDLVRQIEEIGGVAFKQREEGMEMGSGPHFQGYNVYFLPPSVVYEQSKLYRWRDEPEQPLNNSFELYGGRDK